VLEHGMGILVAQCHLAVIEPGALRLVEAVAVADVEAVAQVPTELAVVIVELLLWRRRRQDPELELPDLCALGAETEDFNGEAQLPSHPEGGYKRIP
jgi:hypothetical protein